jgi:hypothetical protein
MTSFLSFGLTQITNYIVVNNLQIFDHAQIEPLPFMTTC